MHNEQWFERARVHIPGGVNSPVRAFGSVGGTPRFFVRGEGACVWDVDGKRYIDYVGSWGPLILGHAHPEVLEAVRGAIVNGMSFGAPTTQEVDMAELLCQLVPSMQQVRLVSSGTEATMSAIRLARGFTGRDVIIKFEGCYHGHADSLLVKAGSGLLTFAQVSSAGVPQDVSQHTWVLEYNNLAQVEEVFASHGDRIAAVIVEPVAGNMNLVTPADGFLAGLRRVTEAHGALLIFDEVMTGFRVALGGAQALYGVQPDLTTLGKVIGGGLPAAAFGGRADVMACLAPLGPVYQAGTLSGNPVAVAAGMKTLQLISQPGYFDALSAATRQFVDGVVDTVRAAGLTLSGQSVGGMFGLYFAERCPQNYAQIMACDKAVFNRFFHAMLAEGVYLAPSAFEAGFVSSAHSAQLIADTIAAAGRAAAAVRS